MSMKYKHVQFTIIFNCIHYRREFPSKLQIRHLRVQTETKGTLFEFLARTVWYTNISCKNVSVPLKTNRGHKYDKIFKCYSHRLLKVVFAQVFLCYNSLHYSRLATYHIFCLIFYLHNQHERLKVLFLGFIKTIQRTQFFGLYLQKKYIFLLFQLVAFGITDQTVL